MEGMEIVHLPSMTRCVPCFICGKGPCNWVKRPINQPYYMNFSLYPATYQPKAGQYTFIETPQPNNTNYCSKECANKK
jgi:hypothetical protein